ncbi:hypothetical protein [Paenarthrobacter sp. PH39-S1]|uniref:hypothetical protein n=1 Tax=Paenarthrobacter sp. PH39-S1 TaxID=3046204 RepID=UPI0024BA665D|nr:hypothetical protein [Paenarthrobacter sp. PH39-S1]MDJ0356673.1 hypothetical protein [Paenarthrobacter sp. PH39-S1]
MFAPVDHQVGFHDVAGRGADMQPGELLYAPQHLDDVSSVQLPSFVGNEFLFELLVQGVRETFELLKG